MSDEDYLNAALGCSISTEELVVIFFCLRTILIPRRGDLQFLVPKSFHSSGLFRGFAFVEFADPKEAKAATNAFRPDAASQLWFVAPCGSSDSTSEARDVAGVGIVLCLGGAFTS
ncbi:unnamed protein product [Echinostoma caproni]|uniref:RRM domain-containing protein n=1 Tax=Echinostoma caproni TaxID=27848 RepID=A0A183B008_9TREM|nr:unnamed protein product [Echinostoma caproni]